MLIDLAISHPLLSLLIVAIVNVHIKIRRAPTAPQNERKRVHNTVLPIHNLHNSQIGAHEYNNGIKPSFSSILQRTLFPRVCEFPSGSMGKPRCATTSVVAYDALWICSSPDKLNLNP